MPEQGLNPDASPLRVKGDAIVMFAFDLGLAIDLEAASRLLRDATQRINVRRKGRAPAPAWFEYEPAPLRVARDAASVTLAGVRSDAIAECTLYDFGAVSVLFRIPLDVPLDQLPSIAETLDERADLLDEARRIAQTLANDIGAAIAKPGLTPLVEDYAVFALREWSGPGTDSLDATISANALTIAQVLQGEHGPLSPSLVDDQIRARLSFTPSDAAIVGWNAAVLFDADPEDVLVLLEHANVELLEMRELDLQLDALLERAGALLAAHGKRRFWPLGPDARDLQALAELQTDSSLLFEGVNNALKLIGDQYLARVYRLAAEKLHLPDWDAAVLRKLETAESIHDKIAGFQSAKRMEILEVVIVLLIAVSIVLPFFPFFGGK
jgi:hypothetical protein